MADYVEVDTQALESDRKAIEVEVQRIRVEMERLQRQMSVLWTMWDGPAHDEFRRQLEQDYETLEQFCKEIGSLMQMMAYARMQYERCEEQVEQAVASIRI